LVNKFLTPNTLGTQWSINLLQEPKVVKKILQPFFLGPEVHHRVHKNSPLGDCPETAQSRLRHPVLFFNIRFDIIPSMPESSK
jgi:hypothetical protein